MELKSSTAFTEKFTNHFKELSYKMKMNFNDSRIRTGGGVGGETKRGRGRTKT